MDNDNIIVNASDVESAQIICGTISDAEKRNRAVANVLAAKMAAGYFNSDLYFVDSESGLHNFAKILNELDISDIYVNDNYLDVRVYFSEDEICVPKIHFDYGILPVAYMFIKLNKDLSGGTVTGFITPNNVNQENLKDNYFYIKEADLASVYDVESRFNNKVLDTYDDSNEKLYEYLDNTLNINDTIQLYRTLISSKSARTSLLNIVKAESVFNFISVPDEKSEVAYNEVPEVSQSSDAVEIDNNDNIEEVSDADSLFQALEYSTEVTPQNSELIGESQEIDENDINDEEQIDALFTGEQEGVPVNNKKKQSALVPLLMLLIICVAGYFVYAYGYPWYMANYVNNNNSNNEIFSEQIAPDNNSPGKPVEDKKEEPMPNEQVEAPQPIENKEEGNQVSIPAIEKHLDASVLVANLKVDWEVPDGYITNTAAKYYLVKLGKLIQLNLKSELLLLSKPPLSNRIALELHYNPSLGKFDVVGFQTSSGEKTVDDVVMQTVKSSLNLNIGANAESFAKAQGNPILVVHL